MIVHDCPRHGPYGHSESDAKAFLEMGVPHIKPYCKGCQEDLDRAIRAAEDAFKSENLIWNAWCKAGIPTRYLNRTVANWLPTQQQRAAKNIVQAWLNSIEEHLSNGTGLLLQGAPGVGKTHLLCGLCAGLIRMGVTARRANWPDVWAMFCPPFADDREEKFAALASVDVLALDEIGLAASSDKEQARLFDLIDKRYRRRLPTLIATNLTTDTLKSLGERTADRLREMCFLIAIPGESYRSKAAENPIKDPEPFQRPRRPVVVSLVAVGGEDVERRWEAR